MQKLRSFMSSTRAVSALEYAILVGVIVVAIVAALNTFEDQITAAIGRVTTTVQGVAVPAADDIGG